MVNLPVSNNNYINDARLQFSFLNLHYCIMHFLLDDARHVTIRVTKHILLLKLCTLATYQLQYWKCSLIILHLFDRLIVHKIGHHDFS